MFAVIHTLRIDLFLYLKTVCFSLHTCRCYDRAATACRRVDNDIIGVGKQTYKAFEQGYGLLCRVCTWHPKFTRKFHAIHYHFSVIVELWEFVTIQYQSVLAITYHFHVGFQYLCGVILSEHQRYATLEAVSLSKQIVELLNSICPVINLWQSSTQLAISLN